MLDGLIRFFQNLLMAFYNIGYAVSHPASWLDWSDKKALVKFIYYGGSGEFFFALFLIFMVITVIGLFRRQMLWNITRGIEFFSNTVGRIFAWAALLMVLQQVIIVFLQRIFRVSEISIGAGGPFGYEMISGMAFIRHDLSWYAEELKLYNAMIVCLCCAYTFVQGGHVRVDLFYAGARYSRKKIVDMLGALFFIIPFTALVWMYGWFFLWRHLVTPKISATDKLPLLERKAQLLKWNVETIGFSPNGFDAYYLFKFLLVAFAAMMFFQGVAFFYRSLLEYLEGPESEGKYKDSDKLNDELAEKAAAIH